MRLLSLTLDGRYKGLEDQTFSFNSSQGNIIAFIGLNGSGKSQLLELIAEIFAFLERLKRPDFKVKTSLDFGFELIYQMDETNYRLGSSAMNMGSPLAVVGGIQKPIFKVKLDQESVNPKVSIKKLDKWHLITLDGLELPYVVGYSSGQNENLQRSFMKNAVQYFEIQRIRLKRRKDLSGKIGASEYADINRDYLKKYPHIFSLAEDGEYSQDGYLDLKESDTLISKSIYLDYDSAGLMLACLAILRDAEIEGFLSQTTYKYPKRISFQFDFRRGVTEEDSIRDVRLLMRIAGDNGFTPIGRPATDKQYEIYGFDYLAGIITLDLTNAEVASSLREANYNDPMALFNRLYKLQQLGLKNWQYSSRIQLLKDNFYGTVKKPLKTRLPLSITELILSDGSGKSVCLDDLSDGEAQLIEILATAKIFSSKQTLFLFDEPETHLNPSWRTHFYSFVESAVGVSNEKSQLLISTHSPFMISSLKRNNVFQFIRDGDGRIEMKEVQSETYGASFDVLIKDLFDLRSLISQSVIDEIREQLKHGDDHAREWIEANLGLSAEKAYLIRKLSR